MHSTTLIPVLAFVRTIPYDHPSVRCEAYLAPSFRRFQPHPPPRLSFANPALFLCHLHNRTPGYGGLCAAARARVGNAGRRAALGHRRQDHRPRIYSTQHEYSSTFPRPNVPIQGSFFSGFCLHRRVCGGFSASFTFSLRFFVGACTRFFSGVVLLLPKKAFASVGQYGSREALIVW